MYPVSYHGTCIEIPIVSRKNVSLQPYKQDGVKKGGGLIQSERELKYQQSASCDRTCKQHLDGPLGLHTEMLITCMCRPVPDITLYTLYV